MKPLLLQYYVTNRCNAQCTFCEIWSEGPKVDAQKDDVVRNLAIARKSGCRFVDFTGGEPLLHSDLPLFLKEAKKLGFITSVTTNCILFEKRVTELDGLIDLLHFSLDGGSAKVHDQIRGVHCFDSVMKSIPLALRHNLVPDLLYTYTNENIHEVKLAHDIARKYKLMLILDPVFSLDGKDTLTSSTHAQAKKLGALPGVYLNEAFLDLRAQGGNTEVKPLCKAAETTLVISPTGTLTLPCYHHGALAGIALDVDGDFLRSFERKDALKYEGHYPFCEGCHINCYFDPSFSVGVRPWDSYWRKSMTAKAKYAFWKYGVYRRKMPKVV